MKGLLLLRLDRNAANPSLALLLRSACSLIVLAVSKTQIRFEILAGEDREGVVTGRSLITPLRQRVVRVGTVFPADQVLLFKGKKPDTMKAARKPDLSSATEPAVVSDDP